MKKALIIASTSGFIKGFLLNDIKILQEMGYEVHCAGNHHNMVTFRPEELFPKYDAEFHQIDFPPDSPFGRQSLKAAKQFVNLMKEYGFDFIHCHSPIVGAIVRPIARIYNRKCKIIYTTHGLPFSKNSSRKNKVIYGAIEWLSSQFGDAVITINHEDYDMMKKMKCKNVMFMNGVGVDTEKFHNVDIKRDEFRASIGVQNDDYMILYVGALSKRKNHQVIIKALGRINNPNFVFVVCGKAISGEGTYDMLRDMAKTYNVRTIFLGFREDVPNLLACADISVLPSLREGLCFAGVESLAAGVPVVGSKVKGVMDYIEDGKTGFLCDPMDDGAFAEKILLLNDDDRRRKMKDNCIEKAEEYSIKVAHKQLRDIYNTVIGTGGK